MTRNSQDLLSDTNNLEADQWNDVGTNSNFGVEENDNGKKKKQKTSLKKAIQEKGDLSTNVLEDVQKCIRIIPLSMSYIRRWEFSIIS